ncbi:MAG: UbiA family prenyltransferase [Armatimonadetes bacterium]|nr:UbiA family prenyltransferase [Armatimonadota bacterium]
MSPAVRIWHRLRIILEMIKFEHTVFALPFALIGMLLAADGWPSGRVVGWILVAMVGARSSAMAFNRLVDREIDRRNPRTAGRALPAGLLTPTQVWLFVAATTALFLLAAAQLNRLALALAPVALAIIWGYSFTKRFTTLSHLILGFALGIAPSAAWIAVRGSLALPPLLLTAAVMGWVGGFDIIYSLQDEAFDRRHRLRSLPAHLGAARALLLSRLLHLGTIGILLWLPQWITLGGWYTLGVGVTAALLAYEHALVKPDDLSRVNAAFFTVNGFISIGLLCFTALDLAARGRF